jgi:DNA-binding transcriptional LysR family regulator
VGRSQARPTDVLSYTPSAVSQQIAALEREAGTRLLERRARGVVLTEAGQTLVEHAEAILERLEAAEASLAALADLRRGHLRTASFATAGARVLPRAIDAFRARHPAIELTVGQASPMESVARRGRTHPGRDAARGLPLTGRVGDARDPLRAAPGARPSGRRHHAPEPVAGGEARVGEGRAVGAERLDRERGRAVDRQLAEDPPEQSRELRRVPGPDADRDP